MGSFSLGHCLEAAYLPGFFGRFLALDGCSCPDRTASLIPDFILHDFRLNKKVLHLDDTTQHV